ncbi:hypothetical protein MRX96_050112, partial [Rhipicephalus microplus]
MEEQSVARPAVRLNIAPNAENIIRLRIATLLLEHQYPESKSRGSLYIGEKQRGPQKRIIRSEWYHQDNVFKDCLRVQGVARGESLSSWNNLVETYTEVLWNATRPTLVTRRKLPSENRDIVVLGDCQVPEEHLRILQMGPKFCAASTPDGFERLALTR